ncbi:MAG: 50S ribosomal protein L11 [Candidatus Micrarchaeota archaeon]
MKKTIDAIVEGGKATAGPPLGPALGPLGINAGQVVAKINEMTGDFSGMKVPVKVVVNTDDKSFEVHVGSPPTSELVKKEAGIEKGAGTAEAPAGNIAFDALVRIAKGKKGSSLGRSLRDVAKEVAGTCRSLGVTIDGKDSKAVVKEIDAGKHDSVLR